MPADLFDPASRPAPVGAGRRLTVSTSIAMHVAIVLIIIVMPLVGGVSMPSAMRRIDAFIAPATVPVPPLPQPPATARAVTSPNPNAAPIHAPETIAPEVTVVQPGVPQAPGAIPLGTGYGVPGAAPSLNIASLAPLPEPRRPHPVRPGGKVTAPKRISYQPPAYPPIALSARVEGTVILEAIIDETGAVTNLKVLRSIPLLDAAAKEAVSGWRYSPTTLNGVKVPVIMTVTVTFSLK